MSVLNIGHATGEVSAWFYGFPVEHPNSYLFCLAVSEHQ